MATILDVCDYGGSYGGNFIPSLIAVGRAVRERLGLDYGCVFSNVSRGRGWLAELEREGIEYDFLEAGESRRRRAASLTALAQRREAAILRSHFTLFDLECALVGRRIGAGVIWNIHTGNLDWGLKRTASDLVKVRMLGRLCDRVITVSEEIGREARQRGYPGRKVRVVPNGIDLRRLSPALMPTREAARGRLRLDPAAAVALAFCWTPYRKGADVIVEAVAGMEPGERPLVLLVGESELRAYLGEVPQWVRILPPLDDPRDLYAAADVFVSASREEAFSFAIGEAMASRLPVVSSDIPGPAAYFESEGLLTFRNEDPASLRNSLREALDSNGRAGRGEQNVAFVHQRFGLGRHVDGVIDVFRELLPPV